MMALGPTIINASDNTAKCSCGYILNVYNLIKQGEEGSCPNCNKQWVLDNGGDIIFGDSMEKPKEQQDEIADPFIDSLKDIANELRRHNDLFKEFIFLFKTHFLKKI